MYGCFTLYLAQCVPKYYFEAPLALFLQIEMSLDFLADLKNRTVALHTELDHHPILRELISPKLSLIQYTRALVAFYGYYVAVEQEVAKHDWNKLHIHFEERRKTPFLEVDLRHFAIDPSEVPRCSNLPEIKSLHQLLGVFYVMEGSTLGGRMIAKFVKRSLGFDETSGARFFAGYQENTDNRWREARETLTAFAKSSQEQEDVILSASATFRTMKLWFDQTAPFKC